MMFAKRGSALVSTLMTICGVGAIAAAGFVFTGGPCSLKSDANVSAASSTASGSNCTKSCCSLGAVAGKKSEAAVVPAANLVESAKSDCSAKSCCSSKAEAVVVQASNAAAACSKGESCCKSGAKVVQASNAVKSDCSAKSCCSAGKAQTVAISVSDVAPCAAAATAAVKPAVAASSCCSASKTVSNVAAMNCGSKNMPVRIMASASPIVMPAAFFRPVCMSTVDMTQAGCCRSAADNATGMPTCSGIADDGSKKTECTEGLEKIALIPAGNVVAANACSKGESCCKSGAKVVEASNVAKSDCSAKSCCSSKAEAVVVQASNAAACSKGESCCKSGAKVVEASNTKSCADKCSEKTECCGGNCQVAIAGN
jgi:hypothetical protein